MSAAGGPIQRQYSRAFRQLSCARPIAEIVNRQGCNGEGSNREGCSGEDCATNGFTGNSCGVCANTTVATPDEFVDVARLTAALFVDLRRGGGPSGGVRVTRRTDADHD